MIAEDSKRTEIRKFYEYFVCLKKPIVKNSYKRYASFGKNKFLSQDTENINLAKKPTQKSNLVSKACLKPAWKNGQAQKTCYLQIYGNFLRPY